MTERRRPGSESRPPLHAETGLGGRITRTPIVDLSRNGEAQRVRARSARSKGRVDAAKTLRDMNEVKRSARSRRRTRFYTPLPDLTNL